VLPNPDRAEAKEARMLTLSGWLMGFAAATAMSMAALYAAQLVVAMNLPA
jgi:hypothetical protein